MLFLASLAAVSRSDPQAILKAINDNQDGTYTVTFPGAKNTPVTVTAPSDAELGVMNHCDIGKYGIWASLMEKAFGQLMVDHPLSILALSASAEELSAIKNADPSSYLGLRIKLQSRCTRVHYRDWTIALCH